ncbi:MAG: cold-shock protein [Sphingobacteriia bacterium]|nr:cold-shock protein [Sphingobacteriia bacterium]
MALGIVKWFNPSKGFGFIAPTDGSNDVFIHISSLERIGVNNLNEGQNISYDLDSNKGRISAVNIKLVNKN